MIKKIAYCFFCVLKQIYFLHVDSIYVINVGGYIGDITDCIYTIDRIFYDTFYIKGGMYG